jgi:hypothetical protein
MKESPVIVALFKDQGNKKWSVYSCATLSASKVGFGGALNEPIFVVIGGQRKDRQVKRTPE